MSTEIGQSSTHQQPPSYRVVQAVADARDSEPTALEPLNEVIDPDALDGLFRDGTGEGPHPAGRVTFTFADCDVVVSPGGEVEVTPRE